MRAVRAPGLDRPSDTDSGLFQPGRGAGGLFAQYILGQTPKYALNDGPRNDAGRNTLPRLFVRVDAEEMDLFRSSITDTHTRRNLAPRIAGDPRTSATRGRSTGAQDATVRRNANVHSNGYLDFFIQNTTQPLNEKVQVSEALSDNFVLFAFGQSPPVWSFSGFLLNTVQDDQASNMFRLYTQVLRATQMARRQKSMSLAFDSYVLNGVMLNLNMSLASQNELYIPFSFQMILKRIYVTNFTSGWTPTRAGTAFAADLNAIPYDGRPRELRSLSQITATTPAGTEELGPTARSSADPRTRLSPAPTLAQELAEAREPSVLLPQPASRPTVLLPQTAPSPLPTLAMSQNPARPETANPPSFIGEALLFFSRNP